MLTFLGFFSVAVGVVFGVLVVLYAEVDDKLRYSRALLSVLLGGIGYVILRATAQAIYLLFDVARNTQAARETLEKRDREESEPPRKIQAGD